MKRQKGFTLIELLVVILIIGVLATIVTLSLMNVQQRGRDARRKTDVSEMFKAVSTFSAVNNSIVPSGVQINSVAQAMCTSTVEPNSIGTGWINLQNYIGKYMSGGSLPLDPTGKCTADPTGSTMAESFPGYTPKMHTREYLYIGEWQGSKFSLFTQLENTDDQDRNEGSTNDITKGKYKDLFYYSTFYTSTGTSPDWKYLYVLGSAN